MIRNDPTIAMTAKRNTSNPICVLFIYLVSHSFKRRYTEGIARQEAIIKGGMYSLRNILRILFVSAPKILLIAISLTFEVETRYDTEIMPNSSRKRLMIVDIVSVCMIFTSFEYTLLYWSSIKK